MCGQMIRRTLQLGIVLFLFVPSVVCGQGSGARGGAGKPALQPHPNLDPHAVESYITIEGRAEVRVQPTSIRVVLALTTESATASGCYESNQTKERAYLKALLDSGVGQEKIAFDFISMLPVYKWVIEEQEGQKLAVEKPSGYHMQTNVHIEVPTEAQAQVVIREAFKLEISDVIAFDYWTKEIDRYKEEAREKALRIVRKKADLLLGALFEEKPKPINLDESTRVVYPKSLYVSFKNDYSQRYESRSYSSNQRNIPRILAFRPKNTYYHGFFEETDEQSANLPIHPEISVVSTVRFYYAAPGSKGKKKTSDAKGK